MNYLYLDIETIPTGDDSARAYLAGKVTAPANYKDPDKIAAYIAENAQGAWEKSSFDGWFGRVACIGWVYGDDPSIGILTPKDDEAGTMQTFLSDIEAQIAFRAAPIFVGHNVSFDINFLTRRMVILGIQIPAWWPYREKPWSDRIHDTMLMAGGKDMVSLDHLCHAMGIPGKDGMTGADVWPAWQRGEFDKIAEYCRDDVERTRQVHKRFLAAGWA